MKNFLTASLFALITLNDIYADGCKKLIELLGTYGITVVEYTENERVYEAIKSCLFNDSKSTNEKIRFLRQLRENFSSTDDEGYPDPDEVQIKKKLIRNTFSFTDDDLKYVMLLNEAEKNGLINLFESYYNLFKKNSFKKNPPPYELAKTLLYIKAHKKLASLANTAASIKKPLHHNIVNNNYGDDNDEKTLADTVVLTEELLAQWDDYKKAQMQTADLREKVQNEEELVKGLDQITVSLKDFDPFDCTVQNAEYTFDAKMMALQKMAVEKKEKAEQQLMDDFFLLHDVEKNERQCDERVKKSKEKIIAKYGQRTTKLQRLLAQQTDLTDNLASVEQQIMDYIKQRDKIIERQNKVKQQIEGLTAPIERAAKAKNTAVTINFQKALADYKFDALKKLS